MEFRYKILFFSTALVFSYAAFAQEAGFLKTGLKKTDLDVVNEFLDEYTSDSMWSEILDSAPVYGNFCAQEDVAVDFDTPCLNRLDCTCKARQFAANVKKYRSKDVKLLLAVTIPDVSERNNDKNWLAFLDTVTTKLFAAKVVGVDIAEGIKSALSQYVSDRKSAFNKIRQIIDENEVFRRKIEEIRVEKLRFEEQNSDGGGRAEFHPRMMSVSVQPFNLIFGLFLINWENRISDVFTFRLGASVYATGLITDTYLGYGNNNKDFSTFLSIGLKSFIQGRTLSSGLYLEPNLEVGYEVVARLPDSNIRDRDIAFVPGLFFGLEKVFSSGFQFDVGVGGGYHLGIPISDEPFATNFIVPKLRAAIGFAW